MSSERLVVVEFIGTPGAGKTTAARALTGILRERGLDAVSMVDAARPHAARTPVGRIAAVLPGAAREAALWQIYRYEGWREARAFARSPLAVHAAASEAARQLDESVKRHTLTWFARLGGRMRFLRRSTSAGEVLVLDDGFLHRSVALHASPEEAVDPTAVVAYVDRLQAPALVVHVVVPADVCAERVVERGLWRHRTGWSDDDLERYVKNADVVVDVAVTRARARGWRVVEVDNTAVDVSGLEASLTAVADAVAAGGVT